MALVADNPRRPPGPHAPSAAPWAESCPDRVASPYVVLSPFGMGVLDVALHAAVFAWRWAAMVLAPVTVVVFWGAVPRGKARVVLAEPVRSILEAALFLGIGAGLIAVGPTWAADRIILAVTKNE